MVSYVKVARTCVIIPWFGIVCSQPVRSGDLASRVWPRRVNIASRALHTLTCKVTLSICHICKMPEHTEVARIVHFIRKHLVGKTLSKVQAQHDDIVYGKVGTSAAEFQKAIQGKKVVGAGQQGKYFWITMSSPPHPVMHFGMAGWLKIKDADTYYYRTDKPADKEWPPKYWKFLLETSDDPSTQAAFVDPRRLSRIRLVDCPIEDIRNHTPLKENGPDPVADKDIVNEAWLMEKLRAKRVPVKALLLDQANISGIGNWMG